MTTNPGAGVVQNEGFKKAFLKTVLAFISPQRPFHFPHHPRLPRGPGPLLTCARGPRRAGTRGPGCGGELRCQGWRWLHALRTTRLFSARAGGVLVFSEKRLELSFGWGLCRTSENLTFAEDFSQTSGHTAGKKRVLQRWQVKLSEE